MKFIKIFIFIFISLTNSVKADLDKNLVSELEDGGKLIFIRHAYAPGGGDPDNFNLNDCSTQRNLSDRGKKQAEHIGTIFRENKIGKFFKKNKIKIDKVITSEWCRCKDTSSLAFGSFETKNFLNSFYSSKFAKNKKSQMLDLRKYIKNFKSKKNLVLVTHYVVISEALNYAPSSGEIVISDKKFNIIGTFKTNY